MNLQERLKHDGYEGADPVLFYSKTDEWSIFSNFARVPVVLPHPWTGRLVKHQTSEHRYQAMKATNAADYDYVVASDGPFESKKRGGAGGILMRDDWGDSYHDLCYYVMLEVVTAKTMQSEAMQDALIATQDRPIYEDSPTDDIWGLRYRNDYRGKNLLGQALMEVRSLFYGYPSSRPFHV